jgi:acyl carrier protein
VDFYIDSLQKMVILQKRLNLTNLGGDMDKKEISRRVKTVIGRVLGVNENEIDDNANFIFDLGADSMQSIQLVAAFEEEFGIEMEEDRALEVQTVSGAVDFIAEQLD